MTAIATIMATAPVIPVLVIHNLESARPLAEALVAGGLRVLEVTLRTDAAIDAITEMAAVPGAIVGAGTVLTGGQMERSVQAGAQFIVSPGLTCGLGRKAEELRVPLLPGISTASDIMRGLDMGLSEFKFFPAETSGGLASLRALAAPFANCRFCPTGGITAATAPAWLAFDPVICVGGSWVATGTPEEVEHKARNASRLRSSSLSRTTSR